MAKISVVVPIYNSESYLKKCIDSIANQTFGDLEIILVDDGSQDNSGVICDQYATCDRRIKVVHKSNGGVSDARNAGLELSTGSHIGFVDPDDYIDKRMYEILFDTTKKYNCDIAVAGKIRMYEATFLNSDPDIVIEFNSKEKFLESCLFGVASESLCNRLFQREIFDNIRFPKAKTFEDWSVLLLIIDKMHKAVYNGRAKYLYIRRAGSLSRSVTKANFFDAIVACKSNFDMIKKHYPGLIVLGEKKIFISYKEAIDRVIYYSTPTFFGIEMDIVTGYLHEHIFDILKNNYIEFKSKLVYLIIIYNLNAYIWLKKKLGNRY
jgi:glycosyltransferase involved in cell wall biosynthesis